MSKKYREYKANLIELYGHEGKFPSYKITLSSTNNSKEKSNGIEKNGTSFAGKQDGNRRLINDRYTESIFYSRA